MKRADSLTGLQLDTISEMGEEESLNEVLGAVGSENILSNKDLLLQATINGQKLGNSSMFCDSSLLHNNVCENCFLLSKNLQEKEKLIAELSTKTEFLEMKQKESEAIMALATLRFPVTPNEALMEHFLRATSDFINQKGPKKTIDEILNFANSLISDHIDDNPVFISPLITQPIK